MDFVKAIGRIRERDASLFAVDAAAQVEITARFGWTDLPEQATELMPLLDELANEVAERKISDVVLLGMGGSSLAALVFAFTGVISSANREVVSLPKRKLHVLDTTCPDDVLAVEKKLNYKRTLIVVASKSGETIETDALESYFWKQAQEKLGEKAASHFIALTDPGTELAIRGEQRGYRVVPAPPDVGGRFSALSVFGLVPSALIGLDYRLLVAEAFSAQRACETVKKSVKNGGNPAIALATSLYEAWQDGDVYLSLTCEPFALWIEQLVAESLGKSDSGIIPVIEGTYRPRPNAAFEMIVWQWAVTLLGAAMRVNPFDQPDVASAKNATLEALGTKASASSSAFGVAQSTASPTPVSATTISLDTALTRVGPGGYVCVLAYVNEKEYRELARKYVPQLRTRTGAPVLLERGPRYLHSSGQLYKGGINSGVFIVKGETRDRKHDIELPNASYTLGELFDAQRKGDITALLARDRNVVVDA